MASASQCCGAELLPIHYTWVSLQHQLATWQFLASAENALKCPNSLESLFFVHMPANIKISQKCVINKYEKPKVTYGIQYKNIDHLSAQQIPSHLTLAYPWARLKRK